MKFSFLLLLFFFAGYRSDAQLLKKLGDKVKRDAEWRVRYKADQQVNKGLDSLVEVPKKIIEKKKAEKNDTKADTTANTTQSPDNNNVAFNKNTTSNQKEATNENDMTPKDGFITLSLSAGTAYSGFGVMIGIRISGESIKYKNFNEVQVAVTGPSTKDVKQVQLSTDGNFFMDWNPSDQTGDFTVTVTSSDKKTKKSANFKVESFDLPDYDEWPKNNISETKKALDKLKEATDPVEDGVSTKDKEELDNKIVELKEKVEDVLLLYKDLGKANKEMMLLAKKEKKLPHNFAVNFAELDRNLASQASQMKQLNEIADHKPQDNTICEYIVMLNEASAAFQTVTNFWSRSITTILSNIATDKVTPTVVGGVNEAAGGIPAPYDFPLKEVTKIYATSKLDAQSLTTKLWKADIAADLTQFALDVLLKKYCGVFKGEIKHDYTINFRNENGVSWWKYGAEMQGALVLRYPKEGSKGKIIKMKGNIEGNATKFTFYQNAEANDDFHDGTKGKIEVVELKVLKPATVPFVSSLNDPGGFGAVARGLTPASFYITIDAEYDVDANKIKIFFNNALMDFTDAVNNQLIFLEVGADLLPYIKKMTFPIAKVFSTLGSVVRSNNEFTVDKDAKGNLSFTAKANKHLGSKTDAIEHDLNFSISAKKE
jgi:hypothetical protein